MRRSHLVTHKQFNSATNSQDVFGFCGTYAYVITIDPNRVDCKKCLKYWHKGEFKLTNKRRKT